MIKYTFSHQSQEEIRGDVSRGQAKFLGAKKIRMLIYAILSLVLLLFGRKICVCFGRKTFKLAWQEFSRSSKHIQQRYYESEVSFTL